MLKTLGMSIVTAAFFLIAPPPSAGLSAGGALEFGEDSHDASSLVAGVWEAVPAHDLTGVVLGRVEDAQTGQPLSGAQVQIVGSGLGALADAAGRYRIEGVPAGEVVLEALRLGYARTTQTIQVASGEVVTVNLALRAQALGLDAIVVTGTPGEQLRRSLGNTVGRIDAADLQVRRSSRTVEQLFQGANPGLDVNFGSQGRVGGSAAIRIRGTSSMALSSEPLLYIDGVRVNNDPNPDQRGIGVSNFGSYPSRLQELNPEEIESVEVIKGPAAATLYGTEASNGVINIITKRGSAGTPRFSMRVGTGTNWIPDPINFYSASYYRCRGLSGSGCSEHGVQYAPGEIVEFRVLQREKEVLGNEYFRTGVPKNVGGTIEGGMEQLRYYFSMDWDRDEGTRKDDWRTRYNARANVTWTPSDQLDIQFGLGSVRSDHRDSGQNADLGIHWACPSPGCEAGGGGFGVDGPFRGYLQNMIGVFQDSLFERRAVHRGTYTAQVTHRPTSWLTHRVNTGLDLTDTFNRYLATPHSAGSNQPRGSRLDRSNVNDYRSIDYAVTAVFEPSSQWSFSTSGGIQYNQKIFREVIAQGTEFPFLGIETIQGARTQTASETAVENKTLGVYFQEQISWQNRLFLTGAVRGDDNSAFGQDFEFVVYPKISASWVISEEPFWERFEEAGLTQMRLRGAWGRAGQAPDAFAAVRTFSPTTGPGGVGAVTFQNIGNPDLKPEVGDEVEVGFDASVWSDRLSLEATYYSRTLRDAIVTVPSTPSSGFPGTQFQNLGETLNSGIELALNTSGLFRSPRVTADLSLSFSTNRSEVTDMGGVDPIRIAGALNTTGYPPQWFVEGFPLGSIFLKRVVSADIQGSGAAARAVNIMCEGGEVLPQSGPGIPVSRGGGAPVPCAQAPHIFRGSPLPTRLASIGSSVTLFNNLSLFALAEHRGGHTMIDGTAVGKHHRFRNSFATVDRSDPIFLGYDALGPEGWNQTGLIDASFLRLRTLSATYEFPAELSQRFNANRMSLTVSGTNLWMIWQAATDEDVFGSKVMDPEASYNDRRGTDPGGLLAWIQSPSPSMKRIAMSLRVNF